MRCSECGREIPDDSLFCPECGKQQTIGQKPQKEKMKRCTNCGCKIPEDSAFCPECGKRVEKEVVHVQIKPKEQKKVRQEPKKIQRAPRDDARLKKRNKMIALCAGIALGLCVIILVLSAVIKPSINLNKYTTCLLYTSPSPRD